MTKYRFTEPIPMPRGKKYGNNYWLFLSKKIGRRVTAYSNLEYDNLISLEMDHEVEYFCEQPFKASLILDNVCCETIFDVWVLYKNGREEFQEVKYSFEVNNPDSQTRTVKQIQLQKQWCMYNNQNYVIRTDEDLYLGQYYMMNLRYMASKIRRCNIPSGIQTAKEREIIKLLNQRYMNVDDVCSCGVFPKGMESDFLSMMYYKGLICFSNIENEIINGKTEVYLDG